MTFNSTYRKSDSQSSIISNKESMFALSLVEKNEALKQNKTNNKVTDDILKEMLIGIDKNNLIEKKNINDKEIEQRKKNYELLHKKNKLYKEKHDIIDKKSSNNTFLTNKNKSIIDYLYKDNSNKNSKIVKNSKKLNNNVVDKTKVNIKDKDILNKINKKTLSNKINNLNKEEFNKNEVCIKNLKDLKKSKEYNNTTTDLDIDDYFANVDEDNLNVLKFNNIRTGNNYDKFNCNENKLKSNNNNDNNSKQYKYYSNKGNIFDDILDKNKLEKIKQNISKINKLEDSNNNSNINNNTKFLEIMNIKPKISTFNNTKDTKYIDNYNNNKINKLEETSHNIYKKDISNNEFLNYQNNEVNNKELTLYNNMRLESKRWDMFSCNTNDIYLHILNDKYYTDDEFLISDNMSKISDYFFTTNEYMAKWIGAFFKEFKAFLINNLCDINEYYKYKNKKIKYKLNYSHNVSNNIAAFLIDIKCNKSIDFENNVLKDNDLLILIKDNNTIPNKRIFLKDININNNQYTAILGIVKYAKDHNYKNNKKLLLYILNENDNLNIIDTNKLYNPFYVQNVTSFIREYNAIINVNNLNSYLIELIKSKPKFLNNISNNSKFIKNNENELINQTIKVINSVNQYNDSQKKAIKEACLLSNNKDKNILLIQGPPGTGKTHTILGILSSLFIKNKISNTNNSTSLNCIKNNVKILVCTSSNTAVDEILSRVVYKKLVNIDGERFVPNIIRFGNSDLIKKNNDAIQTNNTNTNNILDLSKDKNKDKYYKIPTDLKKYIFEEIVDNYMNSDSNKLIKDRLEQINNQIDKLNEYIKTKENNTKNNIVKEEGEISDMSSVSCISINKDNINSCGNGKNNNTINSINNSNKNNIVKLKEKLQTLIKEKKDLNFNLCNTSNKNANNNISFKDINYAKRCFEAKTIKQADIIFTTLNSSGNEKLKINLLNTVKYDYLIVDEACQSTEPALLIPLYLGVDKLILVGDHKQLPATVFYENSSKVNYNRSLFERLIDNGVDKIMLNVQYRMHKNIGNVVSELFYNNILKTFDFNNISSDINSNIENSNKIYNKKNLLYNNIINEHKNLSIINICNGKENSYNSSYYNFEEIYAIEYFINIIVIIFNITSKSIIDKYNNNNNNKISIAIISPYKEQVYYINKSINKIIQNNINISNFISKIKVNTVDSFQGQEEDIVLISTVRTDSLGFLNDYRRLNVAISRAKYGCYIFGKCKNLASNKYWNNLIQICSTKECIIDVKLILKNEERNISLVNNKIYSLFSSLFLFNIN